MSFFTHTRLQSFFFFALAFLLYANTLRHGFVLDDEALITANRYVQAGLKGIPQLFSEDTFAGYLPEGTEENLLTGGRYRPLSLVFFAVLKQIFGTQSLVFHLFSILLYASVCLLLYHTLRLALKPAGEKIPAALTAWGATLLFAVHPLHTEVVANIKSCDEQLALLAGLGALYAVFQFFDTRRKAWALGSGLLFLLACLAKETALSLLLIAPAALWVFREWDKDWKRMLITFLPLVAAVGAYVLARGVALDWQFAGQGMHDPLNNPFLKAGDDQWAPFSLTEKIATILYTLLQYARLLVWPHPLTHDYYPFTVEMQTFESPAVWAAIVLYALLLGLGVWGLIKRNKAAFGLLFWLAPLILVANIFVPVGTFMAERFLFMPSVGFCLALVAVLVWATDRFRLSYWPVVALLLLLAAALAVLTVKRNPAWASNKTLFQTDLATSSNSPKLHNSLGTLYLTEAIHTLDSTQRMALLQAAEPELRQALELHPTYYDAALAYGACAFYLRIFDRSIFAYRGAGKLNPNDEKPKTGLYYALRYGGEFYAGPGQDSARAIAYLNEAWSMQKDTAVATQLAKLFTLSNRHTEAAAWLEQALSLAPGDLRLREELRKAYLAAGEPEKAAGVSKDRSSFTIIPPGGRDRK